MAPKYENSNYGDSDVPKRNHKRLPLNAKENALDLKKKKNCMLRLLGYTVQDILR
jgi:hypothetical protein